ncbi:MAG: ISAs1 family transposase [Saprospiraceae bacterium]|nr:ISAs1 family transposase [Saprospiraceae bacterium]
MASGNGYVIQVKGNAPNLQKAIFKTMEEKQPDDTFEIDEKNRGRIEKRRVSVYKVEQVNEYKDWQGIQQIIKLESYRYDKNCRKKDKKQTTETKLYITTQKDCNAKKMGKIVRQHWSIENQLNYVKDVVLGEDKCQIEDKKRAPNLGLIRNIMISIYRLNCFKSIKQAIEKFCNRVNEMIELIENISIYKLYN